MFDQTVQNYLYRLPWSDQEYQEVYEAVLRNLEPLDYACTVVLYDGAWNPLLNTTGKEDAPITGEQKEQLAQSLGEPLYFYHQDSRRNQIYLQCIRKIKNIDSVYGQRKEKVGYVPVSYTHLCVTFD